MHTASGAEPSDAEKGSAENPFVLVSCSSVIPLKRVGLIADALAQTDDIHICWHHFGDGSQMEKIKQKAKLLKEKSNISCTLHGFVPNAEYIDMLGDMNADLFITASSTEGGVPVSISEAASFGIPVIATDVGGIPEIVSEQNGILLSENPTSEQVAAAIADFCSLPAAEKRKKAENSLKKWEQNFNSHNNSENFIKLLKQL